MMQSVILSYKFDYQWHPQLNQWVRQEKGLIGCDGGEQPSKRLDIVEIKEYQTSVSMINGCMMDQENFEYNKAYQGWEYNKAYEAGK